MSLAELVDAPAVTKQTAKLVSVVNTSCIPTRASWKQLDASADVAEASVAKGDLSRFI